MMKNEQVDGLKGPRKNLWNIFHATLANIFGIYSCHMDSHFVMWQNIP
jgi:hypothetical protein